MALTAFDIISREAFADSREFGPSGTYERIEAIAHYTLDPNAQANRALTDIAHVERGSNGLIHLTGDVSLLQPAAPARHNRCLLVEAPNRGKRTAQRQFNYAPIQLQNTDYIEPGDGFLMRHG